MNFKDYRSPHRPTFHLIYRPNSAPAGRKSGCFTAAKQDGGHFRPAGLSCWSESIPLSFYIWVLPKDSLSH